MDEPNNSADDLVFAQETLPQSVKKDKPIKTWKLLIVDDDKSVHTMTTMVLQDYVLDGRSLEFHHAYSGMEARDLIQKHPDAACILLDVVMETRHAGLDVARFIREEAHNKNLRIILRTGQPGKAPEQKVILNYDINDYKEKTELTSQKLFTAVTTAIRSFQHLKSMEEQQTLIARKNRLLNEEIARRIVAESNLAKYNKSLERMIEDKTKRLKQAARELDLAKKKLNQQVGSPMMENFSSKIAERLTRPAARIKKNLTTMDGYQKAVASLIRRYEELLQFMGIKNSPNLPPQESMNQVTEYREAVYIDEILSRHPAIIMDSIQGIDLISRTISEIKTFIRITKKPKQPMDICRTVKKAIAGISAQKKKNIDIQFNCGDIPKNLMGSEELILQAFDAILDNSIKAMQEQGIISVDAELEAGKTMISISDTGIGMSPSVLEKAGTPYFSHPASPSSPGMGLFMARHVIENHGGTLTIESTKGEGTTVTITFPAT